jgi:transcriptional regulator with XRE-family HTH domain
MHLARCETTVTMTGKRDRLAARRRAMSFTQEAFAERLGVDVSTVRRWESGRTEPLPWQRENIARVLQVSPGRLDELITNGPTARSRDSGRLLMPSGGESIRLHLRLEDKPGGPPRQDLAACEADLSVARVITLHAVLGILAFVNEEARAAGPEVRGQFLTLAADCAEFAGWLYQDDRAQRRAVHRKRGSRCRASRDR